MHLLSCTRNDTNSLTYPCRSYSNVCVCVCGVNKHTALRRRTWYAIRRDYRKKYRKKSKVRACVCVCMFWKVESLSTQQQPCWNNLKYLHKWQPYRSRCGQTICSSFLLYPVTDCHIHIDFVAKSHWPSVYKYIISIFHEEWTCHNSFLI